MRYRFIPLLALILSSSFPSDVRCSPASQSSKVEIRQLIFPTEYPVGSLRMMKTGGAGGESRGTGIGTAQGRVTIKVPADQTIQLDLNPHCLEHPERLKNIQTAGIDRLSVAYMSMDETLHICDKALPVLPEFKNLISLNVERSDTTDKGLSDFKSLSRIKSLSAFLCGVDGTFLNEPQKLKSLEHLDLMGDAIKGKNLKLLGTLPHLEDLCLNETGIDDDGLKNLPRCPHLKRLHLLGNHHLTDKSLPSIKQQTNLEILCIRETGITFAGILSLRNLKLKELILPVKRYRPNEIEELTKAFPRARLDYRGRGLDNDKAFIYSPLK